MKKNTSWKFTDELSVTFQSSVSGAGEFGLCVDKSAQMYIQINCYQFKPVVIYKLFIPSHCNN